MQNTSDPKPIVIASCNTYPLGNPYIQALCEELKALKHNTQIIPWQKIEPALLPQATLILPLAIWDYCLEIENFLGFLESLNHHQMTLINTKELILWNLSKEYLLTFKNFPITPSIVLKPNHYKAANLEPQIQELCKNLAWQNPVIKPLIGQSGIGVKRMSEGVLAQDYPRGILIQPYLSGIKDGEICLIFINGAFSHSILRKPKAGEWRANSNYGVKVERFLPSQTHINLAQQLLKSLPFEALYARVDILKHRGRFYINELECIEPALYLQDEEIQNFAKIIHEIQDPKHLITKGKTKIEKV